MKPYYRILRLDHGRAPTVQHATLKEAETEALWLAGQHPGEAFEILQVLGVARTTMPSVFWNDGVEPPTEKPARYRMLEAGERIEEGDEVFEDGKWIPRQILGAVYSLEPKGYHYPHRRPIANTSKP